MRVTGKVKVLQNITLANGTKTTNTTWHIIQTEFDISSNAAGDPSLDSLPERASNANTQEVAPDHIVVQAGNASMVNKMDSTIMNGTDHFHLNRSNAKIVLDEMEDSVMLPVDRAAGVVRLRNSSHSNHANTTNEEPAHRGRQLLSLRINPASTSDAHRSRRRHGRHLLDIYGESLVNVNMFTGVLARTRGSTCHMPHMIDTNIMKELWKVSSRI